MSTKRWLAVVSLCLLALFAIPGGASADDEGPPLSVPQADLDKSLHCSPGLNNGMEPVLFVPGTTMEPKQYEWNYLRLFQKKGIPYCSVTLPGNAMGDIQQNGEYVVHAIRTMNADTDRKIQIVGHSQGGTVPRWALKFWPDTRSKVDDVVGLVPSNHGTLDSAAVCAAGCSPAFHQQGLDSKFVEALNSGAETYPGISYTNVSSNYDEVVTPNFGDKASSALRTGGGAISNVATQDICPLNTADHLLTGSADPVSSALTVDALQHPGPADPARISREACSKPFMFGVDPVQFPTKFADMVATAGGQLVTAPKVPQEPALKPYAQNAG